MENPSPGTLNKVLVQPLLSRREQDHKHAPAAGQVVEGLQKQINTFGADSFVYPNQVRRGGRMGMLSLTEKLRTDTQVVVFPVNLTDSPLGVNGPNLKKTADAPHYAGRSIPCTAKSLRWAARIRGPFASTLHAVVLYHGGDEAAAKLVWDDGEMESSFLSIRYVSVDLSTNTGYEEAAECVLSLLPEEFHKGFKMTTSFTSNVTVKKEFDTGMELEDPLAPLSAYRKKEGMMTRSQAKKASSEGGFSSFGRHIFGHLRAAVF